MGVTIAVTLVSKAYYPARGLKQALTLLEDSLCKYWGFQSLLPRKGTETYKEPLKVLRDKVSID